MEGKTGGVGGVQQGVGQLCQSPDNPPASPDYSAETQEEELRGGSALTCSNL